MHRQLLFRQCFIPLFAMAIGGVGPSHAMCMEKSLSSSLSSQQSFPTSMNQTVNFQPFGTTILFQRRH